MKVVLGLGNPGRQYELTRHNVGWWVIDHLADVWHFPGWKRDGEALVTDHTPFPTLGRVRLVKPQTYMNLSGSVLKTYLRREGWNAASDLLVIADDVALPLGTFRVRSSGSAGGHNGLKSIEGAVGSRDYSRLRIGIERAGGRGERPLSDFVLDRFGSSERSAIVELMPTFERLVETWIRNGVAKTMNEFNRRPRPPETDLDKAD